MQSLSFFTNTHSFVTMESKQTYTLCAFDALFTRSVPHILENIFFSLDHKSFKACMKVNKAWRELLSTARYQKRLEELLIEKKENEKKLYYTSRHGNTEEVRRLINNLKVDVNTNIKVEAQPWYNCTPLIVASYFGHKAVVQLLLDAGAMVEMTDGDGCTALMIAANNGHLDVVQMLLNGGADTENGGLLETTPLWIAITFGLKDVAKMLLERGADPKKGYAPI